MFCSKCGNPVTEDARFCGYCGNSLELTTPKPEEAGIPVTAACYIFDGLVAKHPSVMWMDLRHCVFLRVEDTLLEQIVQATPPPQKRVSRQKQVALAFHPYAQHLREYSFEDLLRRFPNSIILDTNRIISFSCLQDYDDERHEYDPYIRFTVKTDSAKYKGAFEYDMPRHSFEPGIRAYLQNKYEYRERVC